MGLVQEQGSLQHNAQQLDCVLPILHTAWVIWAICVTISSVCAFGMYG
jgi:hypothetical protein